jgi:amino acid adenylation domain-containing protein
MSRVIDFLTTAARRLPDKVALVCAEQRLTYREIAARAHALASTFRDRGVARGDRVLIFADNSVEMVVAFWAALAADAAAVPINPQTKADKLGWLIEHCGAAALVTEQRLATTFMPAVRRASSLRAIVVAALGQSAEPDRAIDFASAAAERDGHAPPRSVATDGDLAAIIYTSGSTGQPKGVMLSHGNMVSAAASICEYLELCAEDVVQGLSPMSFDYGLYQMLLSFRQGARLVLAPPFTLPAQVLKQTATERVTFFPGVPTQFALLAQLRDVSRWDLSSVRAVTSTAATLTPSHIATIGRIFPRAKLFSMYGLTECKRCSYLPPADLLRKPDSVGIAIPNSELWIVDEHDRRLGPGQVGELVVRGPHVMLGYWREPDETTRKLRPGPAAGERVLYTGDLCRFDEEGYLYFVARTDDIIKSRGEKVAPKEVELALQSIAGVCEAVVIGAADAILGEAVWAFVLLDDGATLSEADLAQECRARLEGFMVPQRISTVPQLPKTAKGKIDKVALLRARGGDAADSA